MAPDAQSIGPWTAFLADLDREAPANIALHCLGGFAVSQYYGLDRPTGDIDVFDVAPGAAKGWLERTGGKGSALHKQHKLYVQLVPIAEVPYAYEERLLGIFPGQFARLRLLVFDPYDLALSKLTRNLDIDVEDVKHLARSQRLDLRVLEARYTDELRPLVSGPKERHDLTLQLWLAAIREERGESSGRPAP